MCWCNNKKKIFYIFFIKETVTRSCSARVTFVLRSLHVRVSRVTRTCSAFWDSPFWQIITIL